jgi:hypothetical protein
MALGSDTEMPGAEKLLAIRRGARKVSSTPAQPGA